MVVIHPTSFTLPLHIKVKLAGCFPSVIHHEAIDGQLRAICLPCGGEKSPVEQRPACEGFFTRWQSLT